MSRRDSHGARRAEGERLDVARDDLRHERAVVLLRYAEHRGRHAAAVQGAGARSHARHVSRNEIDVIVRRGRALDEEVAHHREAARTSIVDRPSAPTGNASVHALRVERRLEPVEGPPLVAAHRTHAEETSIGAGDLPRPIDHPLEQLAVGAARDRCGAPEVAEQIERLVVRRRRIEPAHDPLHARGVAREPFALGEREDSLALLRLHHAVGPRDLDRGQEAEQRDIRGSLVQRLELHVEGGARCETAHGRLLVRRLR